MGIIPELPLHNKLTYPTLKGWYGSLMKEVQQVQRTIEIRSSTTCLKNPALSVCMSPHMMCIYIPTYLQYIMISIPTVHPNTLIVI